MFKKGIKDLARKAGLEIKRFLPSNSPDAQIAQCLSTVAVNVVFDIGANKGQFASGLRSAGYKGKIVSFEPLSEARRELLKLAQRDDKWLVHRQSVIGERDGEIEINISGNSVSSSVLPILEAHSSAAAESRYIGSELVPIEQIDSVLEQYLDEDSVLFVKIDTQGYESQVLDGGRATIERAVGVLCELSLVPLYEGQVLWEELKNRLELMGFTLWAILKGFTDPRTGRTLQIDGVFIRDSEK